MTRCFIFIVALLAPSVALAQEAGTPVDPGRLAAARTLVTALRLADRFEAQLAGSIDDSKVIDACMRRNTDPNTPEAARKDCIAEAELFRSTIEPLRAKRLPGVRARMLEAAAAGYARLLATEDLKALAAFHATPLGQRAAAVGPALDRAFADAVLDINLQLMIDVLGDAAKEQRK